MTRKEIAEELAAHAESLGATVTTPRASRPKQTTFTVRFPDGAVYVVNVYQLHEARDGR